MNPGPDGAARGGLTRRSGRSAVASGPETAAVLEGSGLMKHFRMAGALSRDRHKVVRAVDGVDLAIRRGTTLGLVGESGCGKSTVGRLLLRLLEPSAGTIRLEGEDITGVRGRELRTLRARMQIVFQDPFASLNGRWRVGDILAAPYRIHRSVEKGAVPGRVSELLHRVGLRDADARKFPHEFSGGQRQRIGIARALALDPEVIVCDEPVSALDVSVQAQVINLLRDLQRELGVSYLFISHDLAVVENISREVAVMYLGRIVEQASRDRLFDSPRHPYTQALLEAVPRTDAARRGRRTRPRIAGEVPSAVDPPGGCPFHPRCSIAEPDCRTVAPPLGPRPDGRLLACHLR